MLEQMGFEMIATKGTALRLEEAGVKVQAIKKLQEGHPNVVDFMIDGDLQLVINTPRGKGARTDEGRIRATAVLHGIPCITTIQAADAAVHAMLALRSEDMDVEAVQDRFPQYGKVNA
jgi:carbamoyl-phosphate synthase large subunit